MPVVGLNDMKEENDDDERQAYYAGGNTNAGGGRCAARRPYGSTSELPGPLKPTGPLAAPWAQLWPGCVAVGQQITRHTVSRATVLCRHTRVAVWPPVTLVSRDSRDTRVAVLCRRSGQEILDPREFMKRARDEMGAQSVEAHRAANPPPG